MSRARPLLPAIAALLALLAAPAAALAVDPVDVTGTVTDAEAAPAVGVNVLVIVDGTDIVRTTTTDAAGAFTVQVEAAVGDTLDVRAVGPTVSVGPDEEGCTTNTTATGRATVTVDAVPLGAVAVAMDTTVASRVCSSTAAPEPPANHRQARPTPPTTDAVAVPTDGRPGVPGLLAVVVGLACVSAGGMLAVSRGRRHVARRRR